MFIYNEYIYISIYLSIYLNIYLSIYLTQKASSQRVTARMITAPRKAKAVFSGTLIELQEKDVHEDCRSDILQLETIGSCMHTSPHS